MAITCDCGHISEDEVKIRGKRYCLTCALPLVEELRERELEIGSVRERVTVLRTRREVLMTDELQDILNELDSAEAELAKLTKA